MYCMQYVAKLLQEPVCATLQQQPGLVLYHRQACLVIINLQLQPSMNSIDLRFPGYTIQDPHGYSDLQKLQFAELASNIDSTDHVCP